MEVLYLYSLKSLVPPQIELEQLEHVKHRLLLLTKKMEPQIKSLEAKVRSAHSEAGKCQDLKNLQQLLTTWNEHCRRLGGHPTGPFQCRIYTEEGPYHWQYTYLPSPAVNH
jgi:hypothetical protein